MTNSNIRKADRFISFLPATVCSSKIQTDKNLDHFLIKTLPARNIIVLNMRQSYANELDMFAITIDLTEHNGGGLPRVAIKEKKGNETAKK